MFKYIIYFLFFTFIIININCEDLDIDLQPGERLEPDGHGGYYIISETEEESNDNINLNIKQKPNSNINVNIIQPPPSGFFNPLTDNVPSGQSLEDWNIDLNVLRSSMASGKPIKIKTNWGEQIFTYGTIPMPYFGQPIDVAIYGNPGLISSDWVLSLIRVDTGKGLRPLVVLHPRNIDVYSIDWKLFWGSGNCGGLFGGILCAAGNIIGGAANIVAGTASNNN